jgi:hypothetical protein
MNLNVSVPMCCGLPEVLEAKFSTPGLALASAMEFPDRIGGDRRVHRASPQHGADSAARAVLCCEAGAQSAGNRAIKTLA